MFHFKMEQKEKECFKCGQILPLTHFYKHPKMADGYLNKCKECSKKDSKEDYNRKIVDPKWKLKERERSQTKMRIARGKGKYISYSSEEKKIYLENYKNKFPEKYAAHILSQRIPIQPCVICGTMENVERHHEDYSRPKDITFLCKKHHTERHVEIRKQQLLNGTK